MTERKKRMPAELVVAFDKLFSTPPETPEEVDAFLRSEGLHPETVGKHGMAVALKAALGQCATLQSQLAAAQQRAASAEADAAALRLALLKTRDLAYISARHAVLNHSPDRDGPEHRKIKAEFDAMMDVVERVQQQDAGVALLAWCQRVLAVVEEAAEAMVTHDEIDLADALASLRDGARALGLVSKTEECANSAIESGHHRHDGYGWICQHCLDIITEAWRKPVQPEQGGER